jgi:hypothetical protein
VPAMRSESCGPGAWRALVSACALAGEATSAATAIVAPAGPPCGVKMMLLVAVRAAAARRRSAVCRLSSPVPAPWSPWGGSSASWSLRLPWSQLDEVGLRSAPMSLTGAGGLWCPYAPAFAARPGPLHDLQLLAPDETTPAPRDAGVRHQKRRHGCYYSKPSQGPTHRDEHRNRTLNPSLARRTLAAHSSFATPKWQIGLDMNGTSARKHRPSTAIRFDPAAQKLQPCSRRFRLALRPPIRVLSLDDWVPPRDQI